MLTNAEKTSYLKRLGMEDIQPPSLSYLFALHRAHVELIPWQTIDIVNGTPVSIAIRDSVQLMVAGRSGYCFHLNGAFGALLHSLGYQVSWHRAGVQPMGQEPRINSFHLGLTVNLTDEKGEVQRWIVDAGLGDMPYEPLPLRMGTYDQGPLQYKVTASGIAKDGWRLEHDPLASFVGVDYAPEAVDNLEEFFPKHEFYSRSPDSPWIDLFLIRHRHATGSNELRGCVWNRREGTTTEKIELHTKSQWLDVLAEVFGEQLVAYSKLEKEELWKRVHSLHEAWKKGKHA